MRFGALGVLALACACSSNDAPPAGVAQAGVTPAAQPQLESSAIDRSLVAPARILSSDLPPLPDLSAAARPIEQVRAVFKFAADHPEVLKYIPCVCGCERMGHQGNDMCFVAGRDKAGKVTEWESHGVICEVCLDIGQDAMRMHNSGASVADIRKAIEAKYVVNGRTTTPTPMPPKGGGH